MAKGYVNKLFGHHWVQSVENESLELVENPRVFTSAPTVQFSAADLNLPLGSLLMGPIGVARFVYDVSGGDDGSEGAHTLTVGVPNNAIVFGSLIDVITTFTGASGDDGVTIAIKIQTANDIVSAIAISNSGNPWDAGLHAGIPVFTAATSIKMTADRTVVITVNDTDGSNGLTAGKLVGYLFYVMSE